MNVSHRYNLVEVILALGVMAIGVVSVMALFPIGANASRDASMETYAANVADEMLQFIKYRLKEVNAGDTQSAIDGRWNALVGSGGLITSNKLGDDAPSWNMANVSDLDNTDIWNTPGSMFGTVFNDSHTIYQSQSDPQLFQLLSHHNPAGRNLGYTDADNPENDFATNVDFRAIANIWKEQIVMDPTQNGSDYEVPYSEGVRIILRVSWPAEIPYSARQKADYVLEVFKPYID